MANLPVILLSKGRYDVHLARPGADITEALALRRACFKTDALTGDAIDEKSQHASVVDRDTGICVAAFRMLDISCGAALHHSYSAMHYDLDRLRLFRDPMLEIGRLCVRPDCADPNVLRLVWGALTGYVGQKGVRMLIGCSSFDGLDPVPYQDAFALLKSRHLAPSALAPQKKSKTVYDYARLLTQAPDRRKALAQMPPLLRMYLSMGGWVSDHAVLDSDLRTLHVFTALDVSVVPAKRKRVLRSVVLNG